MATNVIAAIPGTDGGTGGSAGLINGVSSVIGAVFRLISLILPVR